MQALPGTAAGDDEIAAAIADLRHRVLQMKAEAASLRAQGRYLEAEELAGLLADGERTLWRWDHPN